MSNVRSIVLLMVGCVVLAAGNYLLSQGNAVRNVKVREALVDVTSRPTGLVLERKGAATVVLEKIGRWRLHSPYQGSADEQTVLRMLDALAETPIDDCITDAELLRYGRTRKDFELDPPRVRLTLRSASGDETVCFGARTPAGSGYYAAVSGMNAVYVVPTGVVSRVDLAADAFRRRSLFSPGADSVSAFDIKRGTGSLLAFVRSGSEWKIGGERASDHKVRQLLGALSAANAQSFVWPTGDPNESAHASAALLAGYGLEPESAVTVTLKGMDGADRQVSFGKDAGDQQVYALIQNGTAIAKVASALRDLAVQDPVMFTDSRLFPVEASTVSSILLTDGPVTYSLARNQDGAWRLESPIAAPADSAVVDSLLAKILALSPVDGDVAGVAVSLSTNSAPIAVSRESLLGSDGFAALRSKEILRIDPSLVRRIVSTPGGTESRSTAVLYGRERRQWNVELPKGRGSVDLARVERALAALNPLTAVRIESLQATSDGLSAYGLETPELVLAVDQDREDAVRRNLLIGAKCSGGRYATVGSADAVFVISEADLERLSGPFVKD